MRRHPYRVPILVAIVLIVLASGITYLVARQTANGAGATQKHRVAPGLAPTITVSGNHLLANGRPFQVRGVTMIAFIAPRPHLHGKEMPAYEHFGRQELLEAKAFGANTIRYTVSLGALSENSSWYDPQYLTALQAAVKMTRSLGMNTILTLSSQIPSAPFHCPLPNRSARAALRRLAFRFGHERDVMIELYNEPAVPPTRVGWQHWDHGGHIEFGGGQTCNAIGMQRLIDTLRAAHSENVLIVPGALLQKTFEHVPPVYDPAHGRQIAYGVHLEEYNGPRLWNKEFGFLASKAPVIVTEWNPSSTSQHCTENSSFPIAQASSELLSYLHSRGIGLVGYAFDSPGTIRVGFGSELTSLSGYSCGKPGGGAGELLHRYFTTSSTTGLATQASP